jgi:hypothetical protein
VEFSVEDGFLQPSTPQANQGRSPITNHFRACI